MDGIINIYKEKGFTSFDVVAKMRGILHMKKIGHTGTLDPDAEGVLPVCLGKATKLCSVFEEHEKTYRGVLMLGLVTDTQDLTGTVLEEHREEAASVTREQVLEVLDRFRGNIMQVPPMYSALKVDGKRLYEYARQGKVVERKARPVTIYELEAEEIDLPRVVLRVRCSKGTYIRTLCHDIGAALGCGGSMESLVRIQVGRFHLDQAVKLGQLQELADAGQAESVIMPLEEPLRIYPAFHSLEAFDVLLRNGARMRPDMIEMETDSTGPDGGIGCTEQADAGAGAQTAFTEQETADTAGTPDSETTIAGAAGIEAADAGAADAESQGGRDLLYRAYLSSGSFIGLYVYNEDRGDYKPFKMFV